MVPYYFLGGGTGMSRLSFNAGFEESLERNARNSLIFTGKELAKLIG
jgi:hypothetical protein